MLVDFKPLYAPLPEGRENKGEEERGEEEEKKRREEKEERNGN